MTRGATQAVTTAALRNDVLPPLDSSALEFNVFHEIRRTVVDLIRGGEPTTILGLLLANPDGVDMAEIARHLDLAENLVSWNVDKLEGEDLCVRVEVEGATVVVPLAPYTSRNE